MGEQQHSSEQSAVAVAPERFTLDLTLEELGFLRLLVTNATVQPIVHQRDRKSAAALRSGCENRTSGAALAPRCLQRNATFAPMAETIASMIPSSSIKKRFDAAAKTL